MDFPTQYLKSTSAFSECTFLAYQSKTVRDLSNVSRDLYDALPTGTGAVRECSFIRGSFIHY